SSCDGGIGNLICRSASLTNLSAFFLKSLRLRIAQPTIASEGNRSSGACAVALPVVAKRATQVIQHAFRSMMCLHGVVGYMVPLLCEGSRAANAGGGPWPSGVIPSVCRSARTIPWLSWFRDDPQE